MNPNAKQVEHNTDVRLGALHRTVEEAVDMAKVASKAAMIAMRKNQPEVLGVAIACVHHTATENHVQIASDAHLITNGIVHKAICPIMVQVMADAGLPLRERIKLAWCVLLGRRP